MAVKRYVWKDARPLTWLMTVPLALYVASLVIIAGWGMAVGAGLIPPNLVAANVLGPASAVFYCLGLFAALFWNLRVSRNAHTRGRMEHSPAATIWWYIVPIAGLIMPMLVMAEIWTVSGGEKRYILIKLWWATFLVYAVLNVVQIFSHSAKLAWTQLWVAALFTSLFLVMANQLARLQMHRSEVADVFGDEPRSTGQLQFDSV